MAGKAELVDAIAKDAGLSKKDATAALEAMINTVAGSLKKGERMAIPGLGIFSVAKRDARAGINPKVYREMQEKGMSKEAAATKARIKISASNAAKFRAGKELKDLLNKKRK